MSNLDMLSIAAERYIRRSGIRFNENLQDVKWTGFKPAQDSNTIAAQIYGRVDDTWYYVNITLDAPDIQYMSWNLNSISMLLAGRIDEAIMRLNELAGDPFDLWVAGVREEVGIVEAGGEIQAVGKEKEE